MEKDVNTAFAPDRVGDGKDHLANLANAQTSYDVFRVIKTFCLETGFSRFIVFRMPEGPASRIADLAIITNWDPELIGGYDAQSMFSDSPVFDALKKSTLPYVWRFESMEDNRPEHRVKTVQGLFMEFGITNGVYFPANGPAGQRGAIGLAGSRPDPSREELMEMSFLASHAFEALCNLDVMKARGNDMLTDRERECIYWTACGKTSSEVGTVLKISDNTVNNYLASAAMKLETSNKAHTVAKAIRYGLLDNL